MLFNHPLCQNKIHCLEVELLVIGVINPNGSALFPVNFTQISVYSVFKSFILLFALPFVIVKGVQNIIHPI